MSFTVTRVNDYSLVTISRELLNYMKWNVGDWFKVLNEEFQIVSIDYQLDLVHSRCDGNTNNPIQKFTFSDMESWASPIRPPEKYSRYDTACECGVDKVYGPAAAEYFHSDWCVKFKHKP